MVALEQESVSKLLPCLVASLRPLQLLAVPQLPPELPQALLELPQLPQLLLPRIQQSQSSCLVSLAH